MCLIVAAHLGAVTLVATDLRWRFSPPGQAVTYEDRGGKLIEVPGGWMAGSGSGAPVLAAFAAASACTAEAEVLPAIRAAIRDLPGTAYVLGATAQIIWTGEGQMGGPGMIGAKGAIGGRSEADVVQALEESLRSAGDLEGALSCVRGLFAMEAAITPTVSPECDIGVVYPDGRRAKF